MGTAGQVDGLAVALLRCVDEPDQVAKIHTHLDRYCHRLRNRLNSMRLSLYLARKLSTEGDLLDWPRVEAASRSIEGLIDQLQQFSTPMTAATAEGDLGAWIGHRLGEWRRQLAGRSIRLDAEEPGEPLMAAFDGLRLARGLDGLIASWAESSAPGAAIRLSWGRAAGRVFLRFDADERLSRLGGDVESLALPMLARLARSQGGSMTISDDGAAIELDWPSS